MDHLIQTPQQLSVHLRGLRRARNLTQAQAGSRIRLSQKRLSALERNPASMTVSQLLALSGVLGFDIVIKERHPAGETLGPEGNPAGNQPPAEW